MKEGTVPVPPDCPCAMRCCCITFLRVIANGGSHSGGGETPMSVQFFQTFGTQKVTATLQLAIKRQIK